MNTTEARTGRRSMPTAELPEVRLIVTGRARQPALLDHDLVDPPDDPDIAAIVAAATPHAAAESWMITGGEPTLRPDFPQLIRALADAGAPRLGLVTDGLALAAAKVPGMLAQLGLTRVRIRLAGARHDAHDWLFGKTGAWRRAVQGLRAAVDAGLEVEVECTVTRPTRPYLDEAVSLFVKLGAKAVVVRRITARGPSATHDVALQPRLGLLGADVEKAVQHGVRQGAVVWAEGFPRCAVPAIAAQVLPDDAVVWAVPDQGDWRFLAPRYAPPAAERGCGVCPGDATCRGAPSDYVVRFGRTEIDSESSRKINPGKLPDTPLLGGEVYPPPRAGRFPPTRLSYVRLASKLPSLAGDPLVAVQRGTPPDTIRLLFLAPARVNHPELGDHPGPSEPEDVRPIRIRMVQAAQHGARTLRIASAGSMAHPAAAELLRETTRLQMDRIEVAGEGSALDDFSDMQLRRLRGLTRVDVALYGPDAVTHDAVVGREGAFEAALRGLDRLGALVPSIELGCYAVLTSAAPIAAFAEAWDFGDLPGEPWFRLAPTGGRLEDVVAAAEALPAGPARDALAAVLPKTLFDRPDHVVPAPEATDAWGDVPSAFAKPSGSDRFGCYTDRPSRDQGPQPGDDPGVAIGWTVDGTR